MVRCERCGANCDNGELRGGICPECIEEDKQRQIRAESVCKMMNSESHQIKLRLEELRSG